MKAWTNLQFLCLRQEFRFPVSAKVHLAHLPLLLVTLQIRVQHEMLLDHNRSEIFDKNSNLLQILLSLI